MSLSRASSYRQTELHRWLSFINTLILSTKTAQYLPLTPSPIVIFILNNNGGFLHLFCTTGKSFEPRINKGFLASGKRILHRRVRCFCFEIFTSPRYSNLYPHFSLHERLPSTLCHSIISLCLLPKKHIVFKTCNHFSRIFQPRKIGPDGTADKNILFKVHCQTIACKKSLQNHFKAKRLAA